MLFNIAYCRKNCNFVLNNFKKNKNGFNGNDGETKRNPK